LQNSSKNIKFGFIVFVALIVFCLAQLTWWIIFQIDRSSEHFEYQLKTREQKIDLVAKIANAEFSRIINQINYFEATHADPAALNRYLELILAETAVAGYSFKISDDNEIIVGESNFTFHTPIGDRIAIFFSKQYVIDLFGENASDIAIDFSGWQSGDNKIWVDKNKISVAPETINRLRSKSDSVVTMFVSEGSIFFIIMIFGAYLIYRALKKSEELKINQTNFMNAVTHELKTPLTAIILYLETLQNANIDSSKTSEIYSNMICDCDRLDGMVNNVLEASRLDSSEFKIELSFTNLSDDINNYLDNFDIYIRQQKGEVSRDIKSGIYVMSNFSELNRVIRLLVENGLKYSPPDHRVINLRLEKIKDKARITIADKGFGIENSEIENIFKRFYRINNNNSRVIKGTGLGLFIAEQIIKAHRGTIKAQSAGHDKGTSFMIELPMVTK